jgi:F-type H+-transporting ATPase subunit gamma
MGAKLRTIRRRIRSVQSTKKITSAMEMIAASQIRKAQDRMEAARPYADQLTQAITDITSQSGRLDHPMLEVRDNPEASGILAITSDRGLAGAYSANVLRRTEDLMATVRDEGKEPKLFVVGRKGISYFNFRERSIEARWEGFSERPDYENAKEVGEALIEAFQEHEIDEIHEVYTKFESTLVQRATARRIVPMVVEDSEESEGHSAAYLFEPEPALILERLLPRYIQARIYASMLEAAASEHSARRQAMSAATENAEEIVKNLSREANQIRQAEITTEIMEIVGAAEALSQAEE